MKFLLAALFVLVLLALALAGRAMLRRGGEGDAANRSMARALAWRVALSALAFVLIWVAHALGWIEPTGIVLRR